MTRQEHRVRLRFTDEGRWPPPVGAEVTVTWGQEFPVVSTSHIVPVDMRCVATVIDVERTP